MKCSVCILCGRLICPTTRLNDTCTDIILNGIVLNVKTRRQVRSLCPWPFTSQGARGPDLKRCFANVHSSDSCWRFNITVILSYILSTIQIVELGIIGAQLGGCCKQH